ncbi:MAG: hypothetical protein ACNA7L_09120 [Roseinatronobacter sp.]
MSTAGNLTGASRAGTVIDAGAQTAFALAGQSAGRLAAHAQAGGVLETLCAVDAAPRVHIGADRDIGLTGFAAALVGTNTSFEVVAVYSGVADGALSAIGVAEAVASVQNGASAQTRVISAANSALTLIGSSSVSSLPPLFGQAIAGISIDGLARADAAVVAAAASEARLGATATGVAALQSAVRGAVDIAGPSETGVAILGQSGRSIAIFGVATSVSGLGSQATGALAVQGAATTVAPRAGRAAGAVQLSGVTGMRGVVAGAGRAVFDIALHADGAVPLLAVAGSLLALDAIAQAGTASGGTGSSLPSLTGQSAAAVTATVRASSTVALTPDIAGAVVLAGAARGTIDVRRALAGDADVTGDAARQITFGGHATGRSALDAWAPEGALDLSTVMTARASVPAGAQGGLGFAGDARVAIDIAAAAKPGLGFAWATAAAIGLRATATSAVSFGSAAGMRIAARGSTRSAFEIAGAATSATTSAARTGGEMLLDLYAKTQSSVSGSGTGAMEIARAALGTVPVTAHAARSMLLGGTGAGSAAGVAKAALARLRVKLATSARTRSRAGAAVAAAVDGSGAAGALTSGAARLDLGFTRQGFGEAAVEGTTLRSIAFLGDAGARIAGLAAATVTIAPTLQCRASNSIAMVSAQPAQIPGGHARAYASVAGQSTEGLSPLYLAATALRAPPALQRSEAPSVGLSGRLLSSNSGRILRG